MRKEEGWDGAAWFRPTPQGPLGRAGGCGLPVLERSLDGVAEGLLEIGLEVVRRERRDEGLDALVILEVRRGHDDVGVLVADDVGVGALLGDGVGEGEARVDGCR